MLSSCFTRLRQHDDAIRYAQAAVQACGVDGLRLRDHGIESFEPNSAQKAPRQFLAMLFPDIRIPGMAASGSYGNFPQ